MDSLNIEETCEILNKIMEYELAGVVRYTHYALMVTGPYRLPIVDFMQAQATESLTHAQQAGEIMTGLGGHPTQGIATIEETNRHDMYSLLKESEAHERMALSLYKELLATVQDKSVYLEEYARQMIGQEELHTIEIAKMLRDFDVVVR
jgi:bacterioferritin